MTASGRRRRPRAETDHVAVAASAATRVRGSASCNLSRRWRCSRPPCQPLHGSEGSRDEAHRDPPLERLAHVHQARLAIGGRARRHFHEQVRFGGAEPVDRARPPAHAGLLRDRRSIRGPSEHGREVESLRVVDESVARVGKTDDRDADAVSGREPRGLRVERAHEPLAHRAEADDPDAQGLHGMSHRFRTGAKRDGSTQARRNHAARTTARSRSVRASSGHPRAARGDRRRRGPAAQG
jgi:hypothetical protein